MIRYIEWNSQNELERKRQKEVDAEKELQRMNRIICKKRDTASKTKVYAADKTPIAKMYKTDAKTRMQKTTCTK